MATQSGASVCGAESACARTRKLSSRGRVIINVQLLFGTRVVHLRSSAERRVSTLVTRTTDTATGVSNQPQYGFNIHDRRHSDSLRSRR